MNQTFIRQTLIDRMRRHGESLEQAASSFARGMDVPMSDLTVTIESIRREGRRNMLLDSPPGVYGRSVADEARMAGWYTGPEEGDEIWPRLRAKLESGNLGNVVEEVDKASTKVVAHLADPHVQSLKKRGLVVGYVQSGKTANYTAVMAKAADAGYRLFIVLSGLHNNLRRQTQVRLTDDLVDHDWAPLTSDDADFGRVIHGAALLSKGVISIAVVKKNPTRLRSLRDWLMDIPERIRRRVPILLLDDEADQATPNSAAAREQLTRINELVRQIWAEIPTGTYVGYTATPFANIFMDPNDEEELYPADFIIDLPRPDAYFGAERVFGREPIDDADDPDPGLDMVRDVPDDDAELLKPPSKKDMRESFDPELPGSLIDAVTWFLVATAIRRARGQRAAHSSMLVHTTHYVAPHFAMKQRLNDLLAEFRVGWEEGRSSPFRTSFDDEGTRAAEVATLPLPTWSKVEQELAVVLRDVRVVVDNGSSDDRLDYNRADGEPVAETVIAVGGGTLSRGLTLEGLVVSYFTRTSNTYDTLLQMGRWFGYRPGYEDLPRIWMQPSLAAEFKFLSLVEEEIRQDMHHMERMKVTPRELGVRVRAHPGRLAIVARNKMHHADIVRVSYSGERNQTFIFDETNPEIIAANHKAVADFLAACQETSTTNKSFRAPRWSFVDVPAANVVSFISSYQFHPDQSGMHAEHMVGWIQRAAPENLWNVVVIGNNKVHKRPNGNVVTLGEIDLGLADLVPAVNRAPLISPPRGTANIKALLSHDDWFADLDPEDVKTLGNLAKEDPREVRRKLSDGRGLVIVYPISKDSIPMGAALKTGSRRDMKAADHLIGIGLIFPDVERDGFAEDGTYYSVHPDWEAAPDDDDEVPEDREGSLTVDGEKVAPKS
ncbi:MAG TPA: Z1 domain-containing protein [Streptosporangiaceae bacterium]|nr:Z1 domain-containing protein [Streptosporangiaceae bacterium]